MNLGIVTSFVVGGLLLLSIMHMNFTVSSNSMQTTLQMLSKQNLRGISQTLTSDFQQMGYNVSGNDVDDVLNSIGKNEISFQADVDHDGSVETVIWRLTSDSYDSSTNPNDLVLERVGPVQSGGGSVTSTYPAISFELTYYDTNHEVTSNIDEIDQIGIEIITESPAPVTTQNGNENYSRSFWQRTIVPPSLHIRQIAN